jgi:hypothetical protein
MPDQITVSTFDPLSRRQKATLCDIAFGGDGGRQHPKTLESLARLGLIEPYADVIDDPNPRLRVRVTKYRMPIHVHIPFCAWCATQPEDEDFGE